MLGPIALILSRLTTLSALALLSTWSAGRLLSDRMEWSQYLYWVPTPIILGLTGLLLPAGAVVARWARRRQTVPSHLHQDHWKNATRGGWLAWLLVLGWMLIGEWHLHRYARPAPRPTSGESLRVLFWNPVIGDRFADSVISTGADVLVIANAPAAADWVRIREVLGPETSTVRHDRLTIVSRYQILRWGWADLNIQGARPRSFIWRGGGYVVKDSGEGMFVELDTGSVLGAATVVWALDFPSDFNLSRWKMMREAAATLENGRITAFRRNSRGSDELLDPAMLGFPEAGIIVGDFNTPRGSASMNSVSAGLAHAFDDAGRGYAATWPREFPVFAIDQAFVRPPLRAVRYDVLDLGEGKHRAEVLEVVCQAPPLAR